MNFVEYQHAAGVTATYPNRKQNLIYPALGLAGESGETVDKIKKFWRNEGITSGRELSEEQIHGVVLELGDVLWYISNLADELGVSLELIADLNIKKLKDRRERGVIKGEGDNR